MPNCPLTLRTVKGSKLTFNELDGNFLSLNSCISNLQSQIDALGDNSLNNRWHVPLGTTVVIDDGYQGFVYGDLYVEGLIELNGDSQLVIVNGDVILSGGTISGTGTTYLVNLPTYNTFVTGGTYNISTQSIDLSGNYGFNPFSVDLSSLSTDNFYLTAGTYNSLTNNIDFTGNNIATDFSVNVLALSNDITVVSGVYNNNTGIATFTNSTGGTFDVSGFLTGYTNYYTTGATLNGTTIEFDRTDLLNAYSVDLSSLKFTGNTSGDCISDLHVSNIHACSPLNINPLDEGNVYFGSTSGVTIDVLNSRVGIGTTTPSYLLDVKNEQVLGTLSGDTKVISKFSGRIGGTGGTNSNNFRIISTRLEDYSSNDWSRTGLRLEASIDDNGTANSWIEFRKPTFSSLNNQIAFGESSGTNGQWMIIDNGNVGIGIDSPSAKLHVNNTGSGNSFLVEDDTNPDSTPFVIDSIGRVGIGTPNPGEKVSIVNGNQFIWGSGNTNTGLRLQYGLSNSFWVNTPSGGTMAIGGIGTSAPSSGVINITSTGNVGVGTSTPSEKLHVNGNSIFSGATTDVVKIYGSGTTTPIFSIQGSSGELFSVSDSLIGSLFSVNDISGLPILETFSDNTILMGSYQAPSLNTTIKKTLLSGSNTVYSIPTSAYTGAFFDYTLISSTGARAGNVMAIWSGTTSQYTDVSTNDIGDTSGVIFSVSVTGTTAMFSSSANTSGWTLKTIVRSI